MELRAEGDQRGLGDHCLVEVEERGTHVPMLGPLRIENWSTNESGYATKAAAHSWEASPRAMRIT